MTRILAFANQKGGVGKTTSAINVACGAARYLGRDRVLVIDIDPQANATHTLLGIEMAAGPRRVGVHTVREVLLEEVSAADAIRVVELDAASGTTYQLNASNIHVLPSHLELATIEAMLTTQFRSEYRLQKAMTDLNGRYDAIIIDCPPSLGNLTLNALLYCDGVIIPVSPGEFSLVGLGLLQSTIAQAQEANPRLHIAGILPNMTNNTRLSKETVEALAAHFGDRILPSVPSRVAIGEAHSSGGDIFAYAPETDGAAAYYDAIRGMFDGKA